MANHSKDVIQVDDRWYVLATSSHTDDRTRVLKHDELFGLFDRWGDIQPIGLCTQGLYYQGTRFLSQLELTVNERRPMLLNSTIQEDNALMVVDLTLPDLYEDGELKIRKGTVHIFRSKVLWRGQSYEHLRLHNYNAEAVAFNLEFVFDADYYDMFEVRGLHRVQRGELKPNKCQAKMLHLGYHGLDGSTRYTRIRFSKPPQWLSDTTARFSFQMPPASDAQLYLSIGCDIDDVAAPRVKYESAIQAHRKMLQERLKAQAEVCSSNEQFNDWLNRSAADLRMLTSQTQHGEYPYAGIPWFSTPFGRDALITALQTLWLNPELTRDVLAFLSAHQATEEDPRYDAEPGKILHEMRSGEMAVLGETPFACYYGTVDATPLYIMLAGAYYRRSSDRAFIQSIWPNICRALEWIDQYGDIDGDGFVEYARHSENGLVQQGWKDSDDSVFHQDGTPASAPIALCEVQGYVYEAKREAATMAQMLGEGAFAEELKHQAKDLKERFNEAFWCEDIQTFALALDGQKRPCKVRSSNAGHVLATGIADKVLGKRAAETILSPESFNEWGVRTIAAGEVRYNPMSYHNGTIWPHDSAMVAAGLARYKNKKQANKIMTGLFNASIAFDQHRLPELFCGFDRLPGQGPTLYPVACLPQAWASGAVFHLLQSCLGLVFSPEKPQLRFYHPRLPDYLHRLKVINLRFANGSIDLSFHRHPQNVSINVLRREGDIEIVVIV